MPVPIDDPALAERARRAAERGLCPHCLGRLFGKAGTGLTNPERAARLGAPTVPVEACTLCEGLFAELDSLAAVVAQALAPYEFETYLVGSRLDPALLDRETALAGEVHEGGEDLHEAMNSEVNREVGKRLAALGPGIRFDAKAPQIAAVVDTRFDSVTLQHGGLFLFGRYRKFERGIPQTWWPCGRCHGRGCRACDLTGKQYPTSVQELVQAPAMEASGATEAAFHGAGREDVDARCLGTGRPFVLELKDPRRRALDPAALEREINARAAGRVEVEGLRFAEKSEVVRVKDFHGRKAYVAKVAFAEPVATESLNNAIAALRARAIAQRTPARVEHRRADKVRERVAHDVTVERHEGREAVLRIVGDAGLYIKELVSGDEGRTRPSVAELVGTPARVEELDVVAVEYEGETEGRTA